MYIQQIIIHYLRWFLKQPNSWVDNVAWFFLHSLVDWLNEGFLQGFKNCLLFYCCPKREKLWRFFLLVLFQRTLICRWTFCAHLKLFHGIPNILVFSYQQRFTSGSRTISSNQSSISSNYGHCTRGKSWQNHGPVKVFYHETPDHVSWARRIFCGCCCWAQN